MLSADDINVSMKKEKSLNMALIIRYPLAFIIPRGEEEVVTQIIVAMETNVFKFHHYTLYIVHFTVYSFIQEYIGR